MREELPFNFIKSLFIFASTLGQTRPRARQTNSPPRPSINHLIMSLRIYLAATEYTSRTILSIGGIKRSQSISLSLSLSSFYARLSLCKRSSLSGSIFSLCFRGGNFAAAPSVEGGGGERETDREFRSEARRKRVPNTDEVDAAASCLREYENRCTSY